MKIMKMKFDIILANPPFNLGIKMLTKWFDIANEICTVLPSTWLLGKKQKKDIVNNVDAWEKTEIESIQGSEHFDAGISGEIAIQHFIKGKGNENNSHYDKQERIKFDGKEYLKCEEISKFSDDILLREFIKIIKHLYLNDNMELHMRAVPDDKHLKKYWYKNLDINEYCIKVAIVRGNKDKKTGLPKDDFYSIISNDKNEIKTSCNKFGILYNKLNKVGKRLINFYIPCGFNLLTLYNIVHYLQTDFCRICLYLKKFNTNMYPNVFDFIPWFDFADPIFSKSPSEIDDYLFKKYNISDEIRKHIEDILPDYYNIRK